ncbi:MAG TPA: type II toxin-antitoxin system RelE/ParE family toxin [Mucilaginibacter sp.]
MDVIFDRSFSKSLNKLNDKEIRGKIEEVIIEVESADSLIQITNVKKMQGFKTFYRIRIGDYRIGIELENPTTLRFIIVLHRKDIYKKFP